MASSVRVRGIAVCGRHAATGLGNPAYLLIKITMKKEYQNPELFITLKFGDYLFSTFFLLNLFSFMKLYIVTIRISFMSS